MAPPIYYKPDFTVRMKPKSKSDSLKVNIKTQAIKSSSGTILIYVPVLNTDPPEALLRLLTLIQKIIKCHSLTTIPQMYAMLKRLLLGESLQASEKQAKANGNDNK